MVRYEASKNIDEADEPEPMKAHRLERKYRGHKLAVAVGHNKYQRAHPGTAGSLGTPLPKSDHSDKLLT